MKRGHRNYYIMVMIWLECHAQTFCALGRIGATWSGSHFKSINYIQSVANDPGMGIDVRNSPGLNFCNLLDIGLNTVLDDVAYK